MADTTKTDKGVCFHCGGRHYGVMCPHVAAITYYPDGTVERVEYREPMGRTRWGTQQRNRLTAEGTAKRNAEVIELYKSGSGVREIAAAYSMSESGVTNIISRTAAHLMRTDGTHLHGVKK